MVKITEDELRRMNKTSIELRDGTGYIGYLESHHMLHCVVGSHRVLPLVVDIYLRFKEKNVSIQTPGGIYRAKRDWPVHRRALW